MKTPDPSSPPGATGSSFSATAGEGAGYALQRARIGTAGWSIPARLRDRFGNEGTTLARYAAVFNAVEINSSFYRPHQPDVYRRWAESVPADFRFAAKLPQEITHDRRLAACRAPLKRFVDEVAGLGGKLRVLLVQLPPSLAFEARNVDRFFGLFRSMHPGPITVEPRHRSWFEPSVSACLAKHAIGRVAADPARVAAAAEPLIAQSVAYYRLHGSPRMYWSPYDLAQVRALGDEVEAHAKAGNEAWAMFDNTASQAAANNALQLVDWLADGPLTSAR